MQRKRFLPGVMALVLLQALPAQQASVFEPEELWEHPDRVQVSTEELLFPEVSTRRFQSRSFFYTGRFDDGRSFNISLFRWSYTLFGGWGISVLVADQAAGTFSYEARLPERELSEAPGRFSIRFGESLFEDTGGGHRLRLSLPGFACDLELRRLLPPWRPGDGSIVFAGRPDLLQRLGLPVPWAEIDGSITVRGVPARVHGFAYSDFSQMVLPMSRIGSPSYAFRVFSPGEVPPAERWFLSVLLSVSHHEYGSVLQPIMLLARGGGWVLTTRLFSLEAADTAEDPALPYPYPRRYLVRSEWLGYSLEGEFVVDRLYHYTDVFAKLPPVFREIASLFLRRPVYFYHQGHFQGTLSYPDGRAVELRLQGAGEYTVVR